MGITAHYEWKLQLLQNLSPSISLDRAAPYLSGRQYDKAIEIAKKVLAENPEFGRAHGFLSTAYWGQHKYPESISESKLEGQFEGDKDVSETAAAMETAFRSGGKDAALRAAIKVQLALRKHANSFVSLYWIERKRKGDVYQPPVTCRRCT